MTGWEKWSFRNCARNLNLPYEQVVYAQRGIRPIEWDAESSLWFWDTNGSPNLGQTTRPNDSKQKKRTFRKVDFDVSEDTRVKLKKGEKRYKYLDFAWELKNLGNMKVTVLPIVSGAQGTILKGTRRPRNQRTSITIIGPSRRLYSWDWPEYWQEFYRPEET